MFESFLPFFFFLFPLSLLRLFKELIKLIVFEVYKRSRC